MSDLTGKTALVCAASRGIGAATALLLAKRGATIVAVSRSESKLEVLHEKLPRDNHWIFATDLSKRHQVVQLCERLKEVGPIHILINNMAGPKAGPLLESEPHQFEQAFSDHILAAHLLTRALVPGMRQAGYGRIINIISTSVKIPIPGLGVSNTIRGAMANWAKTLSLELGPDQITVNNVLPGFTATDRLEDLIKATASKTGEAETEVSNRLKASVPMRRFASADEVAQAIAFLASPQASYISGINLPVDGGRTGCL
ncbi:MAG: SDR family oxidoreductase [Acidobacteria bacterium]|nr:SDR family oxidoreductase [Acidobacteriota bacterium]MCB9399511.1 SDR family oxidoreductase [Acidobacteriota bacterium]